MHRSGKLMEQTFTRTQYRALEKKYSIAVIHNDIHKKQRDTLQEAYYKLLEENRINKKEATQYRAASNDAEERLTEAKNALHCEHQRDRGDPYCIKCGQG